MILQGQGIFLGQETKKSMKTNIDYTIIRVVDDTGKTFEMISQYPIVQEVFRPISFRVDVQQGKYPKYTFVSIED